MKREADIHPIMIVVMFLTALIVPWFCLHLFGHLIFAYSWRDTTPRGPLAEVSDWPDPIQELHVFLNEKDVDTKTFSVYLLRGQPGSTLSEVVCRMDADETAWRVIQEKLELQPHPESNIRQKIVSLADRSWWASGTDAKYFASARLLAGEEADLYLAAYDPEAGIAYIHYHFNF